MTLDAYAGLTPRQVSSEILKSLAPYYWSDYEDGSPHQLTRFKGKVQVNGHAWERLLDTWNMTEKRLGYYLSNSGETSAFSTWKDNPLLGLEFESIKNFHLALQKCLIDAAISQLGQLLNILVTDIPLPRDFSLPEISLDPRWPSFSYFLSLRLIDQNGEFISKDSSEEIWLRARKNGVTATDANKLIRVDGSRRSGWDELLRSKLDTEYISYSLESYALGREREPKIALWVQDNFPNEKFVASSWLFRSQEDARFMATPDLIGEYAIGEIKVSSKPLKQTYAKYRDQVQWQIHVLGAEELLFIVENRYTQEKEWQWIKPDHERISKLEEAAEEFIEMLDEGLDEW